MKDAKQQQATRHGEAEHKEHHAQSNAQTAEALRPQFHAGSGQNRKGQNQAGAELCQVFPLLRVDDAQLSGTHAYRHIAEDDQNLL